MVDAVGNLAKILEISLKIKAAVGTVKLNRRVCLQTRDRANRLGYILSFLSNTDNRDHPVIRPTLIAFEEILVQALDLVTSCQERTFIPNLFKANDLCKKLDRVNNDISHLLLEANFALLCVPPGTIRFVGPTPQEVLHFTYVYIS
jgi:hypothetical protein